jgi:hypothetical protein
LLGFLRTNFSRARSAATCDSDIREVSFQDALSFHRFPSYSFESKVQ